MRTVIRAAAAQFHTTTDVAANLKTLREAVAEAHHQHPDVLVLPEFCNHLSVYDNLDHAWAVACEYGDEWFAAGSELAAAHATWLQFNVTLRRDPQHQRITVTNLVFDPSGTLRAMNDKTVLMGAEGEYLSPAQELGQVIDGGFAVFGSYCCMDGVVPEVPRLAAARGANILMNSLNSFARDEASLHIPVRAIENVAWVIASCKVGPLLPLDKIEWFAAQMGVPANTFYGAGESQIVAPDGEVRAQAPYNEPAVISTEIDLSVRWTRPDQTDLRAQRRPRCYRPLTEATPPNDEHPRPAELQCAVVHNVDEARSAFSSGVTCCVFGEGELSEDNFAELQHVMPEDGLVIASVRRSSGEIEGIVLGPTSVLSRQLPMHGAARFASEQVLADSMNTVDTPAGRVGVLVGDDHLYPETARLLALQSVDLIAMSVATTVARDGEIIVPERCAENRCVVVMANAANSGAPSVVCDLPEDFTLWAPQRTRAFDGTINDPERHVSAGAQPLRATVHPDRSINRMISRGTNLVDGRPWQLCGPLAEANGTDTGT